MLDTFNINLNIHWNAPQEVWDKLHDLYCKMPNWKSFIDGCPTWYGEDDKIIEASVEPSGLQFYARLPKPEWESWVQLFKDRATDALGYAIGEPEDGFDFYYYDS